MKNLLNKVEEFYKAFKQDEFIKDGEVSRERDFLRFDLMDEENLEYYDAIIEDDKVEKADAIGDMLYILCGTILEHNLQDKIEDIFNEIHRSNMSKLDSNGNPVFREDGKIIKGENYFPPNLKKSVGYLKISCIFEYSDLSTQRVKMIGIIFQEREQLSSLFLL